jgi:hypothetical protein
MICICLVTKITPRPLVEMPNNNRRSIINNHMLICPHKYKHQEINETNEHLKHSP